MEENQVNIDNLELASRKQRINAFIVDDLAVSLVIIVMMWNTIEASGGGLIDIANVVNQAFIQVVIVKFLYQTFFVWYYGATLGKMMSKTRIIDFDNFGRVSLVNSALRAVGRILSEMVFYLGFIVAFYTPSRQTFHDKMGRTLVINA